MKVKMKNEGFCKKSLQKGLLPSAIALVLLFFMAPVVKGMDPAEQSEEGWTVVKSKKKKKTEKNYVVAVMDYEKTMEEIANGSIYVPHPVTVYSDILNSAKAKISETTRGGEQARHICSHRAGCRIGCRCDQDYSSKNRSLLFPQR